MSLSCSNSWEASNKAKNFNSEVIKLSELNWEEHQIVKYNLMMSHYQNVNAWYSTRHSMTMTEMCIIIHLTTMNMSPLVAFGCCKMEIRT